MNETFKQKHNIYCNSRKHKQTFTMRSKSNQSLVDFLIFMRIWVSLIAFVNLNLIPIVIEKRYLYRSVSTRIDYAVWIDIINTIQSIEIYVHICISFYFVQEFCFHIHKTTDVIELAFWYTCGDTILSFS